MNNINKWLKGKQQKVDKEVYYNLEYYKKIPFRLEELLRWMINYHILSVNFVEVSFSVKSLMKFEDRYTCRLKIYPTKKYEKMIDIKINNYYSQYYRQQLKFNKNTTEEEIINYINQQILYFNQEFCNLSILRSHFLPTLAHDEYIKTSLNLLTERFEIAKSESGFTKLYAGDFSKIPFLSPSGTNYILCNRQHLPCNCQLKEITYNIRRCFETYFQLPLFVLRVLSVKYKAVGTFAEDTLYDISIIIEIISREHYEESFGLLKANIEYMKDSKDYKGLLNIASNINIEELSEDIEQLYHQLQKKINKLSWKNFEYEG